ncbi:MAG TPA: DoxX family protein [Caldimonas sp.]|nr:DoxX family protein [Caldimonas sp.]
MQKSFQDPVVLAGRILLGLIFVLSGLGKIPGFSGTAGYIAAKGLPLPELLTALTIAVELSGGLALVFGLYTRWAALALAAFSVLAALVFHDFWAVPEAQKMAQNINFMKNLSIAGGMLVLAAFGPGALSVDARRLSAV